MYKLLRSALMLSAALCATHVAASAATRAYTYKRIAVPGAVETSAVALTESGDILGEYDDAEFNTHGFIYSNGTITTFDPPGAQDTYPAGINASGEIVGNYLNSSFQEIGFTYSNGTFTDVAISGATSTTVSGINDDGVVLGSASLPGVQEVYTDTNGTFATVVSTNSPLPTAINASGSVIGYYETGGKSWLSVGGMLKTIPIYDVRSATAYGINSSNAVVGSITANNYKQKSFIYQNGVLKTFDVPGWTSSFASSINSSGVTVGTVSNARGQSAGFIYNGTTFSFVSIPKARSQSALKINDAGQILGVFTDTTTNVGEIFLATPVVQ